MPSIRSPVQGPGSAVYAARTADFEVVPHHVHRTIERSAALFSHAHMLNLILVKPSE